MASPERTHWIPSARAYPHELDVVRRAAAAEGVKVAEYIRAVLVPAAKRRVAREERETGR